MQRVPIGPEKETLKRITSTFHQTRHEENVMRNALLPYHPVNVHAKDETAPNTSFGPLSKDNLNPKSKKGILKK